MRTANSPKGDAKPQVVRLDQGFEFRAVDECCFFGDGGGGKGEVGYACGVWGLGCSRCLKVLGFKLLVHFRFTLNLVSQTPIRETQ